MLRHVRVRGAVILGYSYPLWTIALNAIALNYPIMFVLPVGVMPVRKSLRSRARKRSLAKEAELWLSQ